MSPKKQVVKKSNALINASYSISLAEQRLILLAVTRANGELESMGDMTVHARDYADQWGVSMKTAYEAMQYAASQLLSVALRFSKKRKKA